MTNTQLDLAREAAFEGSIKDYEVMPEPVPHGLKPAVSPLHWFFEQGFRAHAQRIAWVKEMPDGFPISHPKHSMAWEAARRFFTVRRNGLAGGDPASFSTCHTEAYDVMRVYFLVKEEGYHSLAEYPASKYEHLISRMSCIAEGGAATNAVVHRVFKVLDSLHLFRLPRPGGRLLNDGFAARPFASDSERTAMADHIGREEGLTKDAPAEVVFPLLNASIEFIVNYSEDIIMLNDSMRARFGELEAIEEKGDMTKIIASILAAIHTRSDDWYRSETSINNIVHEVTGLSRKLLNSEAYRHLFNSVRVTLSRGLDATAKTDFVLQLRRRRAIHSSVKAAHSSFVALKLGLPFTGKQGFAAPWPIEVCFARKNASSMQRAVLDLWASCYTVIASFHGDRISETIAHEVDCIKHGLDGPYLMTPNFKDRNKAGAILIQPCPKIVAMAVECLKRLGAKARLQNNSTKLFYIGDSYHGGVANYRSIVERINNFADRAGVLKYSPSRDPWKLTPHQFRRFFVTAWINYFEFGQKFEALRRVLDHSSIGGTLRYCAKQFQGGSISEKQRELADHTMLRIALEGLDATGPAAARFKKIVDLMRIRLVPADRIGEWIITRNKRLDVQFNPHPWGYCVWHRSAGAHAQCIPQNKRKTGIPRPANRKQACVCANGCRQFLTTSNFDAFWSNAYNRHARIVHNPAAPAMMVGASREAMEISKKFGGHSDE